VQFDLDDVRRTDTASWVSYVKGVVAELQKLGMKLRGADLEIDSDIPLGAGLSSSASLELSVARALLAIAGESLVDSELAKLCQRAEHNYAGVQCGIMDQYTLACARKGHAILLDCRSLEVQQVPVPENVGFILTDSGVRHRLADGSYNNRAAECATALSLLAAATPGLEQLSDVSEAKLDRSRATLGELLYHRCRHVLTENQRVHNTAQALRDGDLQQIGHFLNAGHVSLRDDFAVSCDEIEVLRNAANASARVLGSRMVGGGFGGCVLSVCHIDDIKIAAREIQDNHVAITGCKPWQHQVAAAASGMTTTGT
jgi:galactokinase